MTSNKSQMTKAAAIEIHTVVAESRNSARFLGPWLAHCTSQACTTVLLLQSRAPGVVLQSMGRHTKAIPIQIYQEKEGGMQALLFRSHQKAAVDDSEPQHTC